MSNVVAPIVEISDAQRSAFLLALSQYPVGPALAAREADVPLAAFLQLRETDPAFRGQWEQVYAEGIDYMAMAAYQRATTGWDEPQFHQGVATGDTKRVYDNEMLRFLLKGHRPEVYRERSAVELSGPGGGPLAVANVELSPARRAAIESAILAAHRRAEADDGYDPLA